LKQIYSFRKVCEKETHGCIVTELRGIAIKQTKGGVVDRQVMESILKIMDGTIPAL
jgi:hypothetical protein